MMLKRVVKVVVVLVLLYGVAGLVMPGLWMIPLYLFGGYTGLRIDSPFLEAHQRAVNSFVESRGFGVGRMRNEELWNDHLVELGGERFKPEKIQLIGLTEEYGDRYFDGAHPPKKEVMDEAEWRATTAEEDEAIDELRTGAAFSRRISGRSERGVDAGSFRVLAPIMAESDCLKCHDVEEGEMIGAFAYTLLPMGPAEKKGLPEVKTSEVPDVKANPAAVPGGGGRL